MVLAVWSKKGRLSLCFFPFLPFPVHGAIMSDIQDLIAEGEYQQAVEALEQMEIEVREPVPFFFMPLFTLFVSLPANRELLFFLLGLPFGRLYGFERQVWLLSPLLHTFFCTRSLSAAPVRAPTQS